MRNSAELRRFPSSHPSLFSGFFWIFWGQMRGGNEGEALYRRPDPVARGGGRQAPPCRPQAGRPAPLAGPLACRPWGGRQGPVARWGGDRPPNFFFFRDFVANLKKKKLHLSPVAPHRATGVYFWNFPKPTYIFEILIFFKYKKEKTAGNRAWGFASWTAHKWEAYSVSFSSSHFVSTKTVLITKFLFYPPPLVRVVVEHDSNALFTI